MDFDLHMFIGAGAYICGGRNGAARIPGRQAGQAAFQAAVSRELRLVRETDTINNTQSFASVPTIMRKGAVWFAGLGPLNSGGTIIFSVSGHVEKPGNFELPLGVPFKDLMELAGGVWKGRKLKAVIPAAPPARSLPGDVMWATNMDYDSVKKAGSSIGTGAVIVMDETTCMVRALERLARFYMSESCGQCTPCREGHRMARPHAEADHRRPG